MPGASNWIAGHKKQAAIGAGAVALFALYRRRQAPSGPGGSSGGLLGGLTGAPATSTGQAQSGTYDSSQLDQYNQLASAISNANDQIGALQTQVSGLAVANTVQPIHTGLPNPANTPGATANGFTRIPNAAAGSLFASAGDTIYTQVAGQYVPVAQGDKRLPTWSHIPAGSSLYIKA